MPDILLEPMLLLGILFWWALHHLLHWRQTQYLQRHSPRPCRKTKTKRPPPLPGLIKKTLTDQALNLTLRQHVAAIGRRVITLAKTDTGLLAQLHLFQAYYNLCLPHASLRQSLPWELIDASDRGAQHWQKTTPAMAAGLTDHVWSLRELLLFRVPPWHQPALE